uniref:Trifunctional nucleotide phosphoesterase protein YfkN n=2 Tax=Cacopsylla melanoneura TaxID=428564 RepID=A0A8D8ZQ47_9HEMI
MTESSATKLMQIPSSISSGVHNVAGWLKQASLEIRQASERALKMNGAGDGGGGGGPSDVITIIHYNDVYNVEDRKEEPRAGAPRFVSAVKSFSALNPLILFSGDVYSPSMLSTFTKGEHMNKVLNLLGTHCAVLGNHEFDFGLEILRQRLSECNFPWLMSNVIDNETGRPLGEGKISHAVQWGGKKVGLMGLVEQEWLETLASVDPEEITYLDYCEVGHKLGAQLRSEGCDYVIALTHMRTPNDIRLAEEVDEIDLILGGHDHVYEVTYINNKYIIKSGTDFRQFSKISVDFSKPGRPDVRIEEINVTSQYEPDMSTIEALQPYSSIMEGKLDEELGHFAVELDARFAVIRTHETNMGNWICDVLLAATGTDCVLLNSGTFRSDKVYDRGPFTLGDLVKLLPIRDPTVVIQVTGEQLWLALENAVCKYPKLEGRFPQVAGLSFAFDPEKPPGSRVDPKFVRIGDEYLDFELKYSMATKQYLQKGCDGYTVFQNVPVLVS